MIRLSGPQALSSLGFPSLCVRLGNGVLLAKQGTRVTDVAPERTRLS
jgi:hypothetical protein